MNLYDTDQFVHLLAFVYRTMVASVPLLEFAIPRSPEPLRAYYERHLEEERGHDRMLLADLAAMGVAEIPPSHTAAQFAGSQYYLIAHDHPAMLLGYMRALEGESLLLDEIDKLAAHHGSPLTALKHHATHDPAHKADLDAMIDSLAPDIKARVLWNEHFIRKLLLEGF